MEVGSVSKTFRLPHQRYSTLKERALHPLSSRKHDELVALRDVSFHVGTGEFFGIVGRNGSGKSTLLKCLAGIYGTDSGSMRIDGRLSPFIELGVGFNPELTARDNVIINAIMLGLSRREARRRFDEIIEFAELQEFVDLKLKNYSSGMSVRLGFSVAVQVDADVLLVDEVLAVGDGAFQLKCFDQFARMRAQGRTILFVTHDMAAIERFCDRAMLLERGEAVSIDTPERVSQLYREINFGRAAVEPAARPGQEVRIGRIWCEDPSGDRLVTATQGDTCRVSMEVEFLRPVRFPVFTVAFRNEVRHTVFTATSVAHPSAGAFAAGDRAIVSFAFENALAQSHYTLTPAVGEYEGEYHLLEQREDVASLIVEASLHSGGVVDLPTRMEVERG
ncbi:MAG: ABC transporter ATP-binding protein [Thermoleophilaceae bacterium]|nr:ABC transporter ATP-binding protein [Thermoleophilaceae bacterium]